MIYQAPLDIREAALTMLLGGTQRVSIDGNGATLWGQKWPLAPGSDGQYMRIDNTGQLYYHTITAGGLPDIDNYALADHTHALNDLSDVEVPSPQPNQYLKFDGQKWIAASGGNTFITLGDTPSSYVGQANKLIQVNAGETGLEFMSNVLWQGTGSFGATFSVTPGQEVQFLSNDIGIFSNVDREVHFTMDRPAASGTYILWGGEMFYSGMGMTWNVNAAGYLIGGLYYQYLVAGQQGPITFANGGTLPRKDTVVFNTSNQVAIKQGLESNDPLAPIPDPLTEVYNTHIDIAGSATTPNTTLDTLYNENLQVVGGEWNTSGFGIPYNTSFAHAGPGGIAHDGALVIAISKPDLPTGNTLGGFTLSEVTPVDIVSVDSIAFWIYLEAGVNVNKINGSLKTSAGNQLISSFSINKGQNGYSGTTGVWEQVVVPKAQWNGSATGLIGKVDLVFSAPGQISGVNVYVDLIQFQLGQQVNQPTGFDEFIELIDTPSSYTGQAGKVVQVNAGETGVEFIPTTSIPVVVTTSSGIEGVGSVVDPIRLNGQFTEPVFLWSGVGGTAQHSFGLRIEGTPTQFQEERWMSSQDWFKTTQSSPDRGVWESSSLVFRHFDLEDDLASSWNSFHLDHNGSSFDYGEGINWGWVDFNTNDITLMRGDGTMQTMITQDDDFVLVEVDSGATSMGYQFTPTGLQIHNASYLNNVRLALPGGLVDWVFTLPPNAGTDNYVLKTNGAGVTSWVDPGTLAGLVTTDNGLHGDGSATDPVGVGGTLGGHTAINQLGFWKFELYHDNPTPDELPWVSIDPFAYTFTLQPPDDAPSAGARRFPPKFRISARYHNGVTQVNGGLMMSVEVDTSYRDYTLFDNGGKAKMYLMNDYPTNTGHIQMPNPMQEPTDSTFKAAYLMAIYTDDLGLAGNPNANVYLKAGSTDNSAYNNFLLTGIAGKSYNTLVRNPTVTEDGYFIQWNNTAGEYTLAAGGGGGISDGDKGDITVTGSGATWTIDNNVVTLAKMQDIATASFLGRNTAAAGDVEVLDAATATSMLNIFTDVLKGVVPASGGGTTNFLRADGTWAAPPGGGASALADLTDVVSAANTNRFALVADGTNGYVGRLLVEEDISDLQAYLTAEVNDLGAAVIWANVPNANITQSSVTQHQAALVITESQISDLQAYLTGNQVITLSGDLSGSGATAITASIANDAVTYAKMQNVVADSVLLGNIAGAGGPVAELTGTQVTALLNPFTDALKGLVPASGGGTTNFLRADGTWAAPPGGGGGAFTDLSDTPGAYTSSGNFLVRVNAGATALEFVDGSAIYAASGHTHLLATGATDVNASATELNLLDLSGLSVGHVLRATGASAAAWQQLAHSDLSGIGTNTHTQIDTHIGDGTVHFTQAGITTVGTITTGVWQGTAIADLYVAGAATWNAKMSNVAEDITPQLGGDLERNGKYTIYNPTVGTNLTGEGDVIIGTIDTNATGVGAVLAQSVADGNFDDADASALNTSHMLALAVDSGTGAGKRLMVKGFFRNDSWTWSRGPIYLSANPGVMTQTPVSGTGEQDIIVGFAFSATVIWFSPYLGIGELL